MIGYHHGMFKLSSEETGMMKGPAVPLIYKDISAGRDYWFNSNNAILLK